MHAYTFLMHIHMLHIIYLNINITYIYNCMWCHGFTPEVLSLGYVPRCDCTVRHTFEPAHLHRCPSIPTDYTKQARVCVWYMLEDAGRTYSIDVNVLWCRCLLHMWIHSLSSMCFRPLLRGVWCARAESRTFQDHGHLQTSSAASSVQAMSHTRIVWQWPKPWSTLG